MKRFQITEAEYEAIKAKEAKTKDKNISRRLRVLMLRYEGKKLDEITKMTNLHRTSITQMCRRYREQGLEEYTRNKHQSHHWLLSWEQEEEILNQFNDGTGKQVTANEIKAVLDEACGKDTGRVYVYNVLKRHGWSKKCPAQGIRKQQTKRLAKPQKIKSCVLDARSQNKTKTVRLMFEDEAGFGRINKPKRCWCPKGQRPSVPCHHIREYRYAFGAVEPLSGESFFLTMPNCDTECTNIFLENFQNSILTI